MVSSGYNAAFRTKINSTFVILSCYQSVDSVPKKQTKIEGF